MPQSTIEPLSETSATESRTAADKRAEDKRKLDAARKAFVAVPQNVKVLTDLAMSRPEPKAEQSFAERAAEKQQSRDEDARAVRAGEKTREQLRLENSHFREIAHEPIQWDKTRLI